MNKPITIEFAEIADIALPIIENHHAHLACFCVAFFFIGKKRKKGGKRVLGTASILTETERAWVKDASSDLAALNVHWAELCGGFAIKVENEWWKGATEKQQLALLDHELCHCSCSESDDGEMTPRLIGHDVEEFQVIIQRHGDWNGEIKPLIKVYTDSQMRLFEDAGKKMVSGLS